MASALVLRRFVHDPQRVASPTLLAQETGVDPSHLNALLDWLAELRLIERIGPQSFRLGASRARGVRRGYSLVLHFEPDVTVSSFCHTLLAERGYPSIGAESAGAAHELLEIIEFDLALLTAFGQSLGNVLSANARLLRRLETTPVIVYGAQVDADEPTPPPIVTMLPATLERASLLATIDALLGKPRPSEQPG